MTELTNQNRLIGDIRHRIIPRYIDPDVFDDPDNQVFVSYDEHFYIHKLLHRRDQSSKSFSAWFCLLRFEMPTVPQNEVDKVNELAEQWITGDNNFFFGHKHTDEIKQHFSRVKYAYYRDNPEAAGILSKKLIGRQGKAHTDEHKKYLSNKYRGEGNPMAGVFMWENPSTQKPQCQMAYSLMPEMYKFYNDNKHKKRGWGYRAFAKHIGWDGNAKCFITPMKYVIENGDPRLNAKWLAFYNDYITR